MKGMAAQSAANMLNLEKGVYGQMANQFRHMPASLYNNLQKGATIEQLHQYSTGTAKSADINVSRSSFFTKEKGKGNGNDLSNPNAEQKGMINAKIFKRSAYHVAIAYHIYLKKLKEKGISGH
jgi:hypothetical protein